MSDDNVQVDVIDAKQLQQVMELLNRFGTREVKNAMIRAIRSDTKADRQWIRDQIRTLMPKKGGLNKWLGKMPAARVDTRVDRASIMITLHKQKHDLASLNRGRLRHPLFGNRKFWYNQSVPAGWWDRLAADRGQIMLTTITHDIKQTLSSELDKLGK